MQTVSHCMQELELTCVARNHLTYIAMCTTFKLVYSKACGIVHAASKAAGCHVWCVPYVANV